MLFCIKLLSKVRMPLLGRKFLMTSVDSEGLIRDDPGCKELLLEAMRYHLLPEQRASLTSERTQERRPDGMRPYIFAIGRHYSDKMKQFQQIFMDRVLFSDTRLTN